MNELKQLNWQTFKETLLQNPTLTLQFQYANNKRIEASYHITEIKQAAIQSVDCGGVSNNWTEVIVQIWEPESVQQERAMKVEKALSIINVVEKILPLNPSAPVKIEFGNSRFDTRQMLPNEITIQGEDLVVDLRPDTVQCKAIERGGSCGTSAAADECCTPATAKPKIELKNLVETATACCTPGGGCC
jgi:hypothetical protein